MTYLFAIIALCLLIVVHEAGHMLVARLFGMRVEKFSIFFGPPLLRWQRGETTYQIASIPLGGFVQIAGMNPLQPSDPHDSGSYMNKGLGARFATIAAGPMTNYLFAFVLMASLLTLWGAPKTHISTRINSVQSGKPAFDAGLRTGDRILAINDREVSSGSELITQIEASKGSRLRFQVRRGDDTFVTSVVPERSGQAFRIGISLASTLDFQQISSWTALWIALRYPVTESARILGGLWGMVTREVSTDQVGGLVEVVRQLKLGFEQSIPIALSFLAMLNVVLGLFNLLPIPALDGGRLVFILYNGVTGRPINQRVETIVHTIGFLLLMGLLILVNARDITRLLGIN